MKPIDVLIKARALIALPASWCQDVSALDARGNFVRANDLRARRFSSTGAIDAVTEDADLRHAAKNALRAVIGGHVDNHNDRHTHAEVLLVFDKAISAQEKP